MDNKTKQIQFVDAVELAGMLGVTARTVLAWAQDGIIPALRFSRRVIRFDPAEVETALKDRAKENETCSN
jgi:excisionase family DNA binding protein